VMAHLPARSTINSNIRSGQRSCLWPLHQCRQDSALTLHRFPANTRLQYVSPSVVFCQLPDALVEQHAGVLHSTPQHAAVGAASVARILV
jgi:hypothetical protein